MKQMSNSKNFIVLGIIILLIIISELILAFNGILKIDNLILAIIFILVLVIIVFIFKKLNISIENNKKNTIIVCSILLITIVFRVAMYSYIQSGINNANELIETMQKESYNAKSFEDILMILKITNEERNILESNDTTGMEIAKNGIMINNGTVACTYQFGRYTYQYTRETLLSGVYNGINGSKSIKSGTKAYQKWIELHGDNGMYQTGFEKTIEKFSNEISGMINAIFIIFTLYNIISTVLIYKLLKSKD